jgi:hypothetical protein
MAEQCVVLDADVFAKAAPGLRDVRLLQGDRELPYAVAESHDDREIASGRTPADDRSIFDTVGVAKLDKGLRAEFQLPPHVPVERITLNGSASEPVVVNVNATPLEGAPEPEIVRMKAAAGQRSLPVTLGANLQHMAGVTVAVTPAVSALTVVAFEMRRREICYQPVSSQPIRMLFGDEDAAPIHYDYAAHYKPTAMPSLAVMGPRETNWDYLAPAPVRPFAFSLKDRLGIAMGLCVAMLVVTLGAIAGMRR